MTSVSPGSKGTLGGTTDVMAPISAFRVSLNALFLARGVPAVSRGALPPRAVFTSAALHSHA